MKDLTTEEYIELFSTFKAELDIATAKLNKDLLTVEKRPNSKKNEKLFHDIMRIAHNIKGSSRIVELPEISDIAQSFETAIGLLHRGEVKKTSELFDILYEAIDFMNKAIAERIKGDTLDVSGLISKLTKHSEATQQPGNSKDEEKERSNRAIKIDHGSERDSQQDKITNLTKSERDEVTNEVINENISSEDDLESHPKFETITPDEKVLISAKKLDDLMDLVGELLVALIKNEQRLLEMKDVSLNIEHAISEHEDMQGLLNKINRENVSRKSEQLMNLYKNLLLDNVTIASNIKSFVKDFERDSRHLSLITDFLQDAIKRTRMLPVSTVFDSFERMVRDLSRKLGKKVQLEIYGREVELDKKILEKVKDPIMHIIRNAIDHGIETPDERIKMKKSEVSRLIMNFEQRGSNIFIRIRDDGKGLNSKQILQTAENNKWISSEEAARMSPEEVVSLIFLPGLTTCSDVTDLSGRGVGMDVVKKNIEDLHGIVEIKTEKNRGTEITIRIPLTLATLNVLLVYSSSELLAIPSLAIDKITRIKSSDIKKMEGKDVILVDNQPIQIVWLKDVLSLPGKSKAFTPDMSFFCLLLSSTKRKMVFIIDELLGEKEIVIKKIGEQDSKIHGISGATVLGTGKIVMILNPVELVDMASILEGAHKHISITDRKKEMKRILVIDDSISTRNFEKNILASAGFDVVVAADGQEGLDKLKDMNIDLIVSDIHMPKISGLELTEQIKSNPLFGEIPVVLISTLDSKDDISKGLEVGADAYITKNTFDRQTLLETIERLI